MKTLKNQSSKIILLKSKIKSFIKKGLWQYTIVIAFICLCAWLFNKPLEAVCFSIAHLSIRPTFEKQYHCTNKNRRIATALCLSLTLTIIFFSVLHCIQIQYSLLYSIPLAFFVSWIGYIAQDRLDRLPQPKSKLASMSKAEFESFCANHGLDDYETQIADAIFRRELKGKELYNQIGYSKRQTLRIKKKLKSKLITE